MAIEWKLLPVYMYINSLSLSSADKYAAHIKPLMGPMDADLDKLSIGVENGFLWDTATPAVNELPKEEDVWHKENSPEVRITSNPSDR